MFPSAQIGAVCVPLGVHYVVLSGISDMSFVLTVILFLS